METTLDSSRLSTARDMLEARRRTTDTVWVDPLCTTRMIELAVALMQVSVDIHHSAQLLDVRQYERLYEMNVAAECGCWRMCSYWRYVAVPCLTPSLTPPTIRYTPTRAAVRKMDGWMDGGRGSEAATEGWLG